MRATTVIRTITFAMLAAALPGCGEDSAPGPPAAGRADDFSTGPESEPGPPVNAKHGELLEIAARLRAGDNHYYGRRRYEQLLALDPATLGPDDRARYDLQIAFEHYKFGAREEAEQAFLRAFQATGSPRPLYLAGVAQLRESVVSNCFAMQTCEGCLVPLRGSDGVPDPSGPRRAIPTLTRFLEMEPLGYRAIGGYLLNLAYMAVGGYPESVPEAYRLDPAIFAPVPGIHRFTDRATAAGLTTSNHAGGAAVDDFDGDGFLDIVTTTSFPSGQMLYYRNRGDGTFEERTEAAGLLGQVGGLNLVHADYDNDGHLDLLVLRGGWLFAEGRHPRSLLRNRGDGTFEDVTETAGLGETYPSQTAAFADYDLDGDLDLFIGNEAFLRSEIDEGDVGWTVPDGEDLPYPSQLFRNEGDGTFTDVAEAAGVTNLRYAKGCAWGDYDGDGDPDLCVSNQWGRNRLYRNGGDGTFTDVAPALGLEAPTFSFPAWFWDYDDDGALDLFIASYGGGQNNTVRSYVKPSLGLGRNALYRNRGDGTFTNEAAAAGLTTLTLTMGANFADVDGDGALDFYLATGTPVFDALVPNVLYTGDGSGGFVDATSAAGLGLLQKGHGVAFGDLDNDGDEDLFLQSGGFFVYDTFFNGLFENPGHGNRWITLRLEGVQSNRWGVGSRIRVTVEEAGERRDLHRWVGAAGSFGSSSLQQEIGLGRADRIVAVEVDWPASDVRQRFEDVPMDRFYRVREDADAPEEITRTAFSFGGT
ncbi:MAG TPA: CRTAC1 family protein [bacterium]|nr:CRTAC1 family protein [bacterium]